ncbi:MAG: gamma-glutamylcyclotransferase family protein [Pseudomonadota bacterium]
MENMNPRRAFFFGYGSLVNRSTHAYLDARPARLHGWRRVWRHTDLRPVAYLTVVPQAGAEIDGLMAAVPEGGWAELDLRERAYDRIDANGQITHDMTHAPDVVVYSIPEGKHGKPSRRCPVLLSYLDVVVQGYLREFGEEGAQAFFDTTDGWDAPVLNDRAAPVYPRSQTLSAYEQGYVDHMMDALKITIMPDVPDGAWRD